MKDKIQAMWAVLMGRGVIYGVRLSAADSGLEGSLAVIGGPWVKAEAVRGHNIFVAGHSEIG